MPETRFYGRVGMSIENQWLRLTVLRDGCHIAEVYDKTCQVNPLWIPPWPSIEPSTYSGRHHPLYGGRADAKLLSGIMGHNLCLDLFGEPSEEEFAAGIPVHGEGSVSGYAFTESPGILEGFAEFPLAQLSFRRTLRLRGRSLHVQETVTNLRPADRPLAWTQHVTFGPPFLDASTQFFASLGQSMVSECDPGEHGYLEPGAIFHWPMAPRRDGEASNLRRIHPQSPSSAYTAHLTSDSPHAFFTAFSKKDGLAMNYLWRRDDFPWLGIWEENCSRGWTPWNRRTLARGMEFGVSPFPETRREMVLRDSLFGTATYKWLPANSTLSVEYWITMRTAHTEPGIPTWPATVFSEERDRATLEERD